MKTSVHVKHPHPANGTIFDFPIKLGVTEAGSRFFLSKAKQLYRIDFIDGTIKEGMILKDFSTASLETLLRNSYIQTVELDRTDIHAVRSGVMELAELIPRHFIVEQCEKDIIKVIETSKSFNVWKRHEVEHSIHTLTNIDEAEAQQRISNGLRTETENIQKILLEAILKARQGQDRVLHDEITRALCSLDPRIWYVLVQLHSTQEYQSLFSDICTLLTRCIDNITVPEYISLGILELASTLQSIHMKHFAERHGVDTRKWDPMVLNTEVRKMILNKMEREKEYISIRWHIQRNIEAGLDRKAILRIDLFHRHIDRYFLCEEVNEKRELKNAEQDLMECCLGEQPRNRDMTHLGIFYISFLKDICKKHAVSFQAIASRVQNTPLSRISLRFKF